MWFSNRSATTPPVQSQKMARDWKFWIYKVAELYYPCSQNKGADQLRNQLRSNCEADLRRCFRLSRLLVFPCGGSFISREGSLKTGDRILTVNDFSVVSLNLRSTCYCHNVTT